MTSIIWTALPVLFLAEPIVGGWKVVSPEGVTVENRAPAHP